MGSKALASCVPRFRSVASLTARKPLGNVYVFQGKSRNTVRDSRHKAFYPVINLCAPVPSGRRQEQVALASTSAARAHESAFLGVASGP